MRPVSGWKVSTSQRYEPREKKNGRELGALGGGWGVACDDKVNPWNGGGGLDRGMNKIRRKGRPEKESRMRGWS